MTCPECGSLNRTSAERCEACGLALALAVGTVLADRYQIESLLGAGGLGRVYRAHDRMLDERVAVKVLHPDAARSTEMSRRFRSEIKLARKVRHRNVCAIHEYGEDADCRFVAMELVDGVDLHRVLQERGALPAREAFDILIQVTKGLAAIHEAGVIHRDLKTPNIMLDSRGFVRLLDFGIAKLRAPTETLAITAVQKVVGTPEYMSPEQIRGDDLDERSDIYGLGCVIYELFTGAVPFRGKSPLDTLLKQMQTPPPLQGEGAKHLPPSLVPVLRRCLAKSSKDRYSSARELIDALRAARNSAFPEAALTSEGMSALVSEVAPPAALPAPAVVPVPVPGPVPFPAPVPASASVPVAAATVTPATPRLAAHAVGPRSSPPKGPPRNRIAGAPPLPASPAPSEPAKQPVTEFSPAGRGWNPSRLGVGLALLGLLAATGAWFRQRSRAEALVPPPLTLAARNADRPQAIVSSGQASANATAPLPDAPGASLEALATPQPEPLAEGPSAPEATLATAATSSPEAVPRRPSTVPTPAPTPVPSSTPDPVATTGTLDLETRPAALVEIDDAPGVPAPLRGVELKAGTRVVKLSHDDFWPITRRLAVEAGRTLRLDVDLSWEAVSRAASREAPFATPLTGSPDDPYFERGLRQLARGDYAEALLTLEPVARRLRQAGKEKELARCEAYVGVALLELNRPGSAKERFERALESDRALRLPPESFSPKVTTFFSRVREAAARKP